VLASSGATGEATVPIAGAARVTLSDARTDSTAAVAIAGEAIVTLRAASSTGLGIVRIRHRAFGFLDRPLNRSDAIVKPNASRVLLEK